METSWKSIPRHHACGIIVALIVMTLQSGCATWRSLHPTDPLAPGEHLNLGVSYEHGGKPELALREYERAAIGSTKSMALTYQANIYTAQNNTSKAEKKYRAALKADPDNVIALNNFAWFLAQQGHSLDEAEKMIRHALSLNPDPRDAYENTLKTILETRRPEPLAGSAGSGDPTYNKNVIFCRPSDHIQ